PRFTSSVLAFARAPAAGHGEDGTGDGPGGGTAQEDGRLGAVLWRSRTGDDWLLALEVRGDGRVLDGPCGRRRIGQSGGEDVDADAVRGVSRRGLPAERDDRPFCRRVSAGVEVAW